MADIVERLMTQALWAGDTKVLPDKSKVEILCFDPFDPVVPARQACWVRHWPSTRDYPVYRSCDLSDLEIINSGDDAEPIDATPEALRAERDAAYRKGAEDMRERAAVMAEGPATDWGFYVGGTPERDKIAAAIRKLEVKE